MAKGSTSGLILGRREFTSAILAGNGPALVLEMDNLTLPAATAHSLEIQH